jgi:hypothetical protein
MKYESTHMFSLRFNNLQAETIGFACSIDDVLSCEIRINGIVVGKVGQAEHSTAEMSSSRPDYLLITHQFSFNHGKTPWGWHERFSLHLSYGPIPKDVAADIQNQFHIANKPRLENFQYRQISRNVNGISSIEFMDIHFRETSMKWGDPLHAIAWRAVSGRMHSKYELRDQFLREQQHEEQACMKRHLNHVNCANAPSTAMITKRALAGSAEAE